MHLGNWGVNLFVMLILGIFSPAFRICFLKRQEEAFWQLPSAGVYFWALSDVSTQLMETRAVALLRPGSAAPLSPAGSYTEEKPQPPSDEQSVSDRKSSAFHEPSGAGKSTKTKMLKVSRAVQQPKVPENRNWKSFQLFINPALSAPCSHKIKGQ